MPRPKTCRICASSDLTQFLDLGMMPLANGLLDSPDEPEERFPLQVFACQQCGLVQLGHVVPAEKLYAEKPYPFHTASSERMVRHFYDLFKAHYKGGLMVEIGANDGAALRLFVDSCGAKVEDVVGVDPGFDSPDPQMGWARQCFDQHTAGLISAAHYRQASLIVACNVLGHVDDLHGFMKGVTALLAPDGVFVFEVPYLGETLEGNAYDQFYHEHLSYFFMRPLERLMEMHGMHIAAVDKFPVHGGAIRCVARRGTRSGDYTWGDTIPRGNTLFELENFTLHAQSSRAQLMVKLLKLKDAGKHVIAYGASAKGAVVLNYCGIGVDLVESVMDSTSGKIGKWMPGTHQMIVDASARRIVEWPDAILLLAWNHAAEIKAKHPEFKGEWILPHGDA